MWLCLTEFNKFREDESILHTSDDKYKGAEKTLFDRGNLEICRATNNYKNSHFSVAIKNLQSLTDELRVSIRLNSKHSLFLHQLIFTCRGRQRKS